MPSSPTVAKIKRLFAVSGNRCAFPGCTFCLVDHDTGTVLGEICHIRARSEGGPRYDPAQADDDLHGFDNLILMCPAHHKVIDEHPDQWTAERLVEVKRAHETQYGADVPGMPTTSTPTVPTLDDAQVRELAQTINTGGGAYVEGSVDTGGGDFAGRDSLRIGKLIQVVFEGGSIDDRLAQRNRLAMIEKVRNNWIESVLHQSLYQVARIELQLDEQPDALDHPWQMVVQEQGRPPRTLPPGVRMGQVFDDVGGALLILGKPGTGKTTMLLELAEELLNRAELDPGHPIPVVFNLSTWAAKRPPLAEWLVIELNERYDVPTKQAQQWVDADEILPLLDGLDEVASPHQEACAQAINAYRRQHGLVPLAVCGREEEYGALSTQLRLSGAVIIQPLDRDQVDRYLARSRHKLSGMREMLQKDESLYELFDTPLMLSVATLAYEGYPAQARPYSRPTEPRRENLFESYVDRMFGRRSIETRWTEKQTRQWLAWLADQMKARDQTVFYLEWMQPDWLPGKAKRRSTGLNAALVIGLLLAIAVGLASWSLLSLIDWMLDEVVFDLVNRLSVVLGMMLGIGLMVGLNFRTSQKVILVERIHWTWFGFWRQLRSNWLSLIILGSVFTISLGLIVRLAFVPGAGVLVGIGTALLYTLFTILMGGLNVNELELRSRPNQGIWLSSRSAIAIGLFTGLIGVLCFGGVGFLGFGLTIGLDLVVVGLLGLGLLGWLSYGGLACLRHVVLRYELWRAGLAPLDYVDFLDYAAERILLRKVGGGYMFIHRTFMEWFAKQRTDKWADEPEK